MAIALITAGGIGARTGNSVPKQFLTIRDVPLIVYTMKSIQESGCFQALYVICSDGWKDFVASYALQHSIDIFEGTISGGPTRFDSYYSGICALQEKAASDEIISIHDGNRPRTPPELFQKSIKMIEYADCVLPLEPCFDSMYNAQNDGSNQVIKTAERETLFKGQSPETCRLGSAYELCKKAKKEGIDNLTLTQLMLNDQKKVLYIEGSSLNFKITTSEDILMFNALLCSNEI